jgi:hypothetical protein
MLQNEIDAERNVRTKGTTDVKPGDCNHSTKCVDCPLCYLFAGQQLSNLSLQPAAFAKEYSILQIHALADYANREWKPPNSV